MEQSLLPQIHLPLHKMSQSELQKFLPTLITTSTGCKRLDYGKEAAKPKWWPQDLMWANPMIQPKATRSAKPSEVSRKFTEALRTAVKNCYAFHNAENLLKFTPKSRQPPLKTVGNTAEDSTRMHNGNSVGVMKEASLPGDEAAMASIPNGGALGITGPAEASEPVKEIFICFYCDMEYPRKSDLQRHQLECKKRADDPNAPPMTSQEKYKPFQASGGNPQTFGDTEERSVKTISKVRYMDYFGLVSQDKAKRLAKQQQGKDKKLHVDCEVIEILDDDEAPTSSNTSMKSPTLKAPPTPKTPKSLISQLSRDLSPPSRRRTFVDYREDSDNESVGSRSDASQPRKIFAVLNIDYCSPLGERVSKYMEQSAREQYGVDSDDEESNIHYEQYCSTPKKRNEDGMLGKLRHRTNQFPVTFKKSRKHCPKICHIFKFTNKARREWFKTREAGGLNRRARMLKRLFVQKCAVEMDRLKSEEIKKWTARKPRGVQYIPLQHQQWNHFQQQLQALYPGQVKPNMAVLNNSDALRRMMGVHSVNDIRSNFPGTVIMTDTGAIVYKTQACEISNGVSTASLTPPRTPEGMRPTPGLLIPNTANLTASQQNTVLAAMLCNQVQPQQYSRPQVARRTGGVQFTRPLVGTSDITNVHVKPAVSSDPICIDLSDDDVVSISSTESNSSSKSSASNKRKRNETPSSLSGSQVPPLKRPRIDRAGTRPPPPLQPAPPPMLLFKCHLCLQEITCRDNFAAQIQAHFRQAHKVTNINLIEHTDSNGQKVVSIVEESPQQEAPLAANGCRPQEQAKKKLFASPAQQVGRRRSSRHDSTDSSKVHRNSPMEVICLD